MVILNHPCMSYAEFLEYRKELDDISAQSHFKNEHCGDKHSESWDYPCLVLTTVTMAMAPQGERYVAHTHIPKDRLLKVLGLSTQEIKMKFDALDATTVTPETFETREV